jgi:hypothetical protein
MWDEISCDLIFLAQLFNITHQLLLEPIVHLVVSIVSMISILSYNMIELI